MNNTLDLKDSFFQNNQAGFSAVAHIVSSDGTTNFWNCFFIGNYALTLWTIPFGVGSAFAIGGSTKTMVFVYSSFFAENFAYINGEY